MNFDKTWTKQSLQFLERYKARGQEIEEAAIRNSLLRRESNKLCFYDITPKEDLPKSLQNMHFQTVHLKEKDIGKAVKLQTKDSKYSCEEQKQRTRLKQQGQIMLLSQIYQHLSQPDLLENKVLEEEGAYMKECITDSTDYKGWVERGLGIIDMSHGSEANVLARFSLIENSSKILKKDLDEKINDIKLQITSTREALYERRVSHHDLFEERTTLMKNDKGTKEDEEVKIVYKSTLNIRYCESKMENTNKIISNMKSIEEKKQQIEKLQQKIVLLEEQLKKVLTAQTLYYKISLRSGTDCRETGLTWVIRKLQNIEGIEFPQYLDKRSRHFLIMKAANDEQLQALLQEKRIFINEIGKGNTIAVPSRRRSSLANALQLNVLFSNQDTINTKVKDQLPKKYRKSIKQFGLLNEEYKKNSSLLELEMQRKQADISANLQGMTNKQIYESMKDKIKTIDLQKLKKERAGNKKKKLQEYQTLLDKIKAVHFKAEEIDLQQQYHLLSAYKENKDLYFLHATACFGYKRAYSMIIKHFSWKTCKQ